jgi:hypothetical protein
MPSHNVNIVVDTEQMVFMVPAKGDCFDQILEVPFSAIKQMDIRNSDKSQTRGICDATLEISNSKDVFCYLDSAGIVLSRISLSAHPGTIEKMAEELSYICGDLVVFIDNVQLQGKSHNDRDAPSQVSTRTSTALSTVDFNAMESTVSKPLVSNGHAVKKPKVIAETQVEEAAAADLPRSSDGFKQDQADEDELHNASPSSQRFKKPPPKPSTQDNTESQTQLKNAGPKPVKPKAKESIRLSQGQNDNDGPPPRNTDPTRASQIQLKNRRSVNEESEDELGNQNEPALGLEPLTKRGLQASVPSTTEAAVAQERSRRGTANGTVLTSTKVTSAFSHPPRATDFDSEEITSPDGNDASTPKPKVIFGGLEQKAASKFNCEVLPKEATQTRSQKLNKDLSAAAQKKPKRYSLKAKTPLSISTSTVTSAVAKSKIEVSDEMFDILEGEDAQESTNTTNKKSETAKTVAKNSASTSKITGKIATQAAKANAKKRQSAPAVIERTVAATRSQRAAAAIASQRMRNADATDDEAELQIGQEEVAKNPKPKATLNGKKVPSQEVSQAQTEAQTEAHAKSHNAKGTELVVNPDNNDDFHLQQEDARSLGLLNGDFNDHDLYGATPKKRVKKPKGKTVFSQNKGVVDAPTTNGSKSTLEMASKLNDMLGDLDDADVSPVQTSGRKDQPISVQDVARLQKHGPLEEDNAESSPNFSQSIREPEPGTICINDRLPTKTADTESQTQPNDNLILISSCVSSGKALEDVLENNSPTRNLRAGGESRLITQPAGDGKHRHDSDDDPKKRKATTEMPAHSKRRRSNIDEAAKDQNSPRNPVIQDKPTGKKGRISPKSNQRSLSPPSRRSPRLVERELEAWDILNGAIAKKILVDDRLTRKPQVIAFGVKGARNQGASSISKPGPQRDPEKVKGTQPKAVAGRDLKRKREEAQLPSDASPPKKRQSVSPPQDYVIDLIEDDNVQSLTGSPPAPQIPQKASSQTSRVDKNGSPIPLARAGQADHFGKIKKKLLDDVAEQKQPTAEPITEDAAVLPRLRNQFDIFGPKVALASTVKAKTSSPAEVQTRYVAHKKTANGVYEEVSTKEVVVDEKTLADPFIEDASCRSSGFTDRLRAEAPKEKRKLDPKSELLRKMSQKPLDEGKEVSQKATNIDKLPWFPQFSLKEKGKLGGESAMPKRVTQIHFEDLEKTLVNAENQHPSDQSSPGDMTSGNSYESHERDLSRSPPKPRLAPSEVWNMTLRPHYTSLSDTVHRIADVRTPPEIINHG